MKSSIKESGEFGVAQRSSSAPSKRLVELATAVNKNWTGRLPRWGFAAVTVLFMTVAGHSAQQWYVRPSSAGANSGIDWGNAWSAATINWPSVGPGDTIWMAGGIYSTPIVVGASGSPGNPIQIKRVTATNSVAIAAIGWSSSFDSTVEFRETIFVPGINYVTIDGQFEYGMKFNKSGICFTATTQGGAPGGPNTGVHLLNIEWAGPGTTSSSGLYTVNWATWSQNLAWTGPRGEVWVNDALISHCYFHDAVIFLMIGGWTNSVIEHCKFYNNLPNASGQHPDVIYAYPCWNLDIRYNDISNSIPDGIFFSYGYSSNVRIYGNVFQSAPGQDGGLGICVRVAEQGASPNIYGPFYIYNNVFESYSSAVNLNGTSDARTEVYNNLFWNSGNQPKGGGPVHSDYNGYNTGKPAGEVNSVQNATDPFISATGGNFRLKAGFWPINTGRTLAADGFVNKDPDGNPHGPGGTAWDIGAYEYGSGPGTNPAVSVSPSILTLPPSPQGMTATNYFTVYNAGGGTLSGTASLVGADQGFRILSGASYSLGANQSQTMQIIYGPVGTNRASQGIIFTGGGGSSNSIIGTTLQVMSGLSFGSYAGLITTPFTASGGYISQAVDVSNSGQSGVATGGRAIYAFNTSATGQYTVSADVICTSGASKAFWVSIDEEAVDPTMIWDNYPYSTNWVTRQVSWRGNGNSTNDQFAPKVFDLSAGVHQLIIVGRDANVQLGRITIARYGVALPPSRPTGLHVPNP